MTPEFSTVELLYMAWRNHVINAYQSPQSQMGYCQDAVIAQMEYVLAEAVEMAKENKR